MTALLTRAKVHAHPTPVAIGIGSNLEPRADTISAAVALLPTIGITVLANSHTYETAALLPEGAPPSWDIPYLNVVIHGQSTDHPTTILPRLKSLEQQLGRTPAPRWAPRCIDLDILIWGRCEIKTPELTVPHPGIALRPFVYVPLLEVWPTVEIRRGDEWCALTGLALGEVKEQGRVLGTRGERE